MSSLVKYVAHYFSIDLVSFLAEMFCSAYGAMALMLTMSF